MAKIKLFGTDVDGVLTDCGMYYTNSGDEFKKFNTRDGMGMMLLRAAGVKTAIITQENTNIVKNRAAKLQVDSVNQGIMNKLECATELCENLGMGLENLAYIGDDVNDIKLLEAAGLKACPADAVDAVKAVKGIIVLSRDGGKGAVREYCELILKSLQNA